MLAVWRDRKYGGLDRYMDNQIMSAYLFVGVGLLPAIKPSKFAFDFNNSSSLYLFSLPMPCCFFFSIFQDRINGIDYMRHQFIPMHYHMPTNCDACDKPLWHMFKPPPGVECKREYCVQPLISPYSIC